jgi:hypothetical protein
VLIGFLIQAATQAQPQTATIHGYVVDRRDGQPLPNTAVNYNSTVEANLYAGNHRRRRAICVWKTAAAGRTGCWRAAPDRPVA